MKNSHAACRTELTLFHTISQDSLHCPADVRSRAWEGGSPISSTFQWETYTCAPWRLGGAGEETVGVHVPKAASPCVNQCRLAFLSETSLSHSGTCLTMEGTRGPSVSSFSSTPFQAPRLLGQRSARELRAAAALHVSAQPYCQRHDGLREGHGRFLNGFFLRKVPVFMQFMIVPSPYHYCHLAFSLGFIFFFK